MILKFQMHMAKLHGFRMVKLSLVQESKMATVPKNSKTFCQDHLVYLAEILYGASVAPSFSTFLK